ncbi:MAG: CHAT domain-containing protein, partial [Chloroflexi bacterium]|nr:CHAT domain-containing protein [Chloroflexota bacterium]
MAVVLSLRTIDFAITPSINGEPLAAPAPLASLPDLKTLQADARAHGRALFAALGGEALRARLDSDSDRLLLIDADEPADRIPWEFAALPDHQWLVLQYGVLRLVDTPAVPAPSGSRLAFMAMAADPLADENGNLTGPRLQLDFEVKKIRRALKECAVALDAERLPPTRNALQKALRRVAGPAILHISCHGNVVKTESGLSPVLFLETRDSRADPLNGRDLLGMAAPGTLRLVLLSACRTAQNDTALARALVRGGVPFAIGMQGDFPDAQSDELAEGLYDTALAGHSLAESLRQARRAISRDDSAVGLPVGYTAREGWGPIPRPAGSPNVRALGLPGFVDLPPEVQPPTPLLGRDLDLHRIASEFSEEGRTVVTICGTGGMGKTALAAAFAARFAWRWPNGARGLSFASDVIDPAAFRAALLRHLLGEGEAMRLAPASAEAQTSAILAAAGDWDGLLLIDNYETILQGLENHQPEAESVHRIVAQLANGGANLLLTSRQQPAGLRGEILYPRAGKLLEGLDDEPAARLFLQHSSKAKDESAWKFANEVARAAEG